MDRDRSNAALSLSRRQLLAAAGAAGAVTAVGAPPAAALPRTELSLSFTAATNGAATLAPGGDRLVAEIQNVLWSLPRTGGEAVPLTPPDLEPNRPVYSPDGRSIAVCAYRGGGFHLWTMRPDGSGLRQRTDGPVGRPRPRLVARRHPHRVRLRARRRPGDRQPVPDLGTGPAHRRDRPG